MDQTLSRFIFNWNYLHKKVIFNHKMRRTQFVAAIK